MFTNLIESSSHGVELKRRGSFLLFTTATYALLFVVAGVISIYAYEAKLDEQNLELVALMRVTDFPAPERPVAEERNPPPQRNASPNSDDLDHYVRRIAMVDTNRPDVAPDKVSAQPNPFLPLPKTGIVEIGDADRNPAPGSGRNPVNTQTAATVQKPIVVDVSQEPPAPVQKPVPAVLRKTVINSEAISLPKPPYPPIARQARVQGTVTVQVLVDESGKVVSAKAMAGHPLLVPAAQTAAYQARFSPTRIGDQPVKVSGVISYYFVLN